MKKTLTLILMFFCFWPGRQSSAQMSFAPLAEKVMPSVVNISTRVKETPDTPDVINNLLFTGADGLTALGSGFIVKDDGFIVTNQHVIEQAGEISVITSEGSTYAAKIIGVDLLTDLALIKIEPQTPLSSVEFGDSDQVRIGDWVLAVGNPFGLGSSVSAGIISAKSRDIESGLYDNYLQTDAAINQGNSGGPLFDTNGKLIGINTVIFSTTGNSVGIGFALPANEARWVVNQLLEKGRVERSWLGIAVKPTRIDDQRQGLLITSFETNELPQKNNLQLGDIILAYNDRPVTSAKQFSAAISRLPVASSVQLTIWQNGKISDLTVTTGLMPDPEPSPENMSQTSTPQEAKGHYLQALNFYLDDFTVSHIENGSEAAVKGVKPGDKLLKAGGINLITTDELKHQIEEASLGNNLLRLDFEDAEGNPYFVELTVTSDKKRPSREQP